MDTSYISVLIFESVVVKFYIQNGFYAHFILILLYDIFLRIFVDSPLVLHGTLFRCSFYLCMMFIFSLFLSPILPVRCFQVFRQVSFF